MSTGGTSSDQTVTVVITTYNDADFLHDALASVALQQKVPNEIFVVDDGSEVSPAPIVALFPEATLIRKPNGGLANGGHIRVSADGSQLGDDIYHPASNDPYADFLAGNTIGMNAVVM